jgi:hypothetical protein
VLLIAANLLGQTADRQPTDVTPQSGTFVRTKVERRKLTITDVLLTVSPFVELTRLDLKVDGLKSAVHPGELKPDTAMTSLSAVTPAQKPQLAGQVVSPIGGTGALIVTADMIDKSQLLRSVSTEIAYEDKNGQLKLAPPKQSTAGAPVTVSAKPVRSSVADGYVVTGEMRIAQKGFNDVPPGAVVQMTAEGVTLLGDQRPVPANQKPAAQTITFAASDGQRGRIIAQLRGTNRDGTPYVNRSYLYVLADPRDVYLSTSGFVDVEIQKLKADLAAHVLTQAEFDRRVKALLSGKAEGGIVK